MHYLHRVHNVVNVGIDACSIKKKTRHEYMYFKKFLILAKVNLCVNILNKHMHL